MVFLLSLSAISIANRGGGWDGQWDRVGWEVTKIPIWDIPKAAMTPTGGQ